MSFKSAQSILSFNVTWMSKSTLWYRIKMDKSKLQKKNVKVGSYYYISKVKSKLWMTKEVGY